MADFLGVFAVVRRGGRMLFVGNDRHIDGRLQRTWDLPGGRVEAGELLGEALARELREETGLIVSGAPEFLFVQEGEREVDGARSYAWRSFFFAVAASGEPAADHEVREVAWFDEATMRRCCTAPYHDSFLAWLDDGGCWFRSSWCDSGSR